MMINQLFFMRLLWIGTVSDRFRREIEHTIRKACPLLKPVVCFTTRYAFSGIYKDRLPATCQSLVIYWYKCCCDQQYVCKMSQVLAERIKRHIPAKWRGSKVVQKIYCNDSAVTGHLKENLACIWPDLESPFEILIRARNKQQMGVLEALFIRSISPGLCKQSDYVRTLELI